MTACKAASDAPAPSNWLIVDPKWNGRTTFKVTEAAEILGISPWAAYEAVKNGEIPAVKIGRRCIVPRHALERLLTAA